MGYWHTTYIDTIITPNVTQGDFLQFQDWGSWTLALGPLFQRRLRVQSYTSSPTRD